MANLIGKTVMLKDWNGNKTGDWGVVKEYDGEYFWIAFAGDENDIKPYTRDEFTVPREAAVIVDTSRYEHLYMQSPRGFGGWLFSDGKSAGFAYWAVDKTYTEAKKSAIEWARHKNLTRIYLEG